jgi:ABC-type Co2+ transport system permease subunit
MDDLNLNNLVVLSVFAGSVVALVAGYLVAWRSRRAAHRQAGSLVSAAVAGFAGLFMSAWLMGAVMPLPPPDGSPLWEPLVVVLVFSPIPLGAFYICLRLIRQTYRGEGQIDREKKQSV